VSKWSQRIHQFLAGKQMPMLKHAPYSSDFALCDFFIAKLKSLLKGTYFQPIEDIHKKTGKLHKALAQNDCRRCFEACRACMGQCVASDGN
jgi:hypothetical protein